MEKSNFLGFDTINTLENYKIKFWANNKIELFDRAFNQNIENSHFKYHSLLDKIQYIIINWDKKYNDYLILEKINKILMDKYNIFLSCI